MKTQFTLVMIVLGMSLAAQPNLDSLWGVWKDPGQPDTSRLKAIRDIAWDGYLFSQPDSAFCFAQLQYEFAEKRGLTAQMAGALTTQAISLAIRGENHKALDHFERSLRLMEKIGDKKGIADGLNNIGRIYMDLGEYQKAMDHCQRSSRIYGEIGDQYGVANALNNMGRVYMDQGDYARAIDQYERSLRIMKKTGDKDGVGNALNNIGLTYAAQGAYSKALIYYQRSLKIFDEIHDQNGKAKNLNNIGIIYMDHQDYTNAQDYFQRCLKIEEEISDKSGIAMALANIGANYQQQGEYPKALEYFQRSLRVKEDIGDKDGAALSLNNIGRIYQSQGDYPKALDHYQSALARMEETGYKEGVANTLNNMGSLHQEEGVHQEAIKECGKGLMLAQEIGVVSLQRDACKCLYEAYKAIGNGNRALEFHEHMTVLNDSLFNEEETKKLTRLEMQYKFDEREAAIQAEQKKKDAISAQKLEQQKLVRNGFMGGFAVVLVFAGVFFAQRNRIGKEKARSDELLLNILPEEVADELKARGHAEAKYFEQATILFTDFKGFTEASEKLSPKDLVEELNICFMAFDHIITARGIEKIKTIGDAYMCVGGLPDPKSSTPIDVVCAALEMQAFLTTRKTERDVKGLSAFEMRVGIHTGPVVAGIVGVKKFQYDIWGDTVNTASRMESSGEVGQVNISEATYSLVKDVTGFTFTPRGKIQAKGKGEREMYFVERGG